jgi:colicin import membrane protein
MSAVDPRGVEPEMRALMAAIEDLRRIGQNGALHKEPDRDEAPGLAPLEEIESLVALGEPANANGFQDVPSKAEIEEWVREQLTGAEERIWSRTEDAREELEERLAKLVERRAVRRIGEEEEAAARRLSEQAARFAEQAQAGAEQRIEEAERKLSWRARRHELKLARQERNRRIAAAERRLAARGEALADQLERQALEAERRLRSVQLEVERRLEALADAAVIARGQQPAELRLEVGRPT